MAITAAATKDTSHHGVLGLASAQARNFGLEMGTIAFGSMPSVGFPMTFDLSRVIGAFIATFNGYTFEYDTANSLITVYQQSSNVAGALTLVATNVDLSALSGVPYLAYGIAD